MLSTSQIVTELESCINSSGILVLPGSALGSQTMEDAFGEFLPNADLVIANAVVGPSTSTSVPVTGAGQGLFSGLQVAAVFTPTASGDVAVVVTGVMPSSWCLSSAFAALANGIYTQAPLASGGTLVLTTLPADGAAPSLMLNAEIQTTGLLANIAAFLAGTTAIPISGPIAVVNQTLSGVTSQTPSFAFSAPVAQELTTRTLTADFTLQLVSTPYFCNLYDPTSGLTVQAYATNAYLALVTQLTFTTKSGPMTVTATMPFSSGPLGGLSVAVSGAPGVLLDSFTDWAGGNLATGLPDPSLFDPSNYLTISGLDFSYLLATGQLLSFTVVVSTVQPWVVIPGIVTISDVTLALTNSMMTSAPDISGVLTGTVLLGSTPPTTIVLQGCAPDYSFCGGLQEGTTADVSALLAYLIPAAVDIPQITLEEFSFYCQPSGASPIYTINAMLSSDWTLAVGPASMAITEAWVNLAYGAASGSTTGVTTGSLGGTIVFNSDITFNVTYAIPGIFTVGGQIPAINLSALIAELVNIGLPLPAGFDLDFTNCLIAICYDSGGQNLSFQVSAMVNGLGVVAFEALEVGGAWGYAMGLSLGNVRISSVPGLSALLPFDTFFVFQELVLVVSTTALSSFAFPVVPAPAGTTGVAPSTPVVLPSSQAIVAGLNAYAQINLNQQPELSLLMNLLDLSATLSVTLQIGTANVANDSMVSAGIAGSINSNIELSGNLRASLVGDVPSLSILGTLSTQLQGKPIVFSMLLSFVPNGALLSGSYTGTIDFVIASLSNLILEIGVDLEGVPTIGYGAQIDTAAFESSVMILLDSAIPSQSMFVGSTDEISLGAFLQNLCGVLEEQPPADLLALLNVVNISGTNPFSIADPGDTLAGYLNNGDVANVSAAFAAAGILPALPSSAAQVIISVASASTAWYVTDMVNILYYKLEKAGSGAPVTGSLDPQLYVVPQTTQLGPTVVQQGYKANGTLNLFGFTAALTVDIVPAQGFSISANFSAIKIAVSGFTVVSFTASETDTGTGPSLSVSTFPAASWHFDATGYINVLGVASVGVQMNFTETGGSFSMTSTSPVSQYTMSGSYGSAFTFSLSGSAVIGVNQTFNFGALGNIPFNANVNYSYSVAVDSATSGSASASGGFTFGGVNLSIVSFTLALNTTSLADIATNAASQVEAVLLAFLNNSAQWLAWLGENIIQGITGGAEQVGAILGSSFQLAYTDIGTQTTNILHYTSDQVTQALQGAGATADETYDVLVNTLGVSAAVATTAIDSFFTGSSHFDVPHADSTGAHVDTGHTDTNTDHVDNGHTDTNTDHVDNGHTDTNTAHVDSKLSHDDAHWDAWGSPHSHTDNAGHDDTSLHTDLPHDDTSLHTDLGHDDTSLHTDLAHDDTAAHFDTPHSDGPV